MATIAECQQALETVAARMSKMDERKRSGIGTRSLACELTDIDAVFVGQLRDGGLHDIAQVASNTADVTMRMTSDDLLALVSEELSFPKAFASGRVKIDASFRDLLSLRNFL